VFEPKVAAGGRRSTRIRLKRRPSCRRLWKWQDGSFFIKKGGVGEAEVRELQRPVYVETGQADWVLTLIQIGDQTGIIRLPAAHAPRETALMRQQSTFQPFVCTQMHPPRSLGEWCRRRSFTTQT
jgi:hypothetical protein